MTLPLVKPRHISTIQCGCIARSQLFTRDAPQFPQAGVCAVMWSGGGAVSNRMCCIDASDEPGLQGLRSGEYGGALRKGVHWWSENKTHTDALIEFEVVVANLICFPRLF